MTISQLLGHLELSPLVEMCTRVLPWLCPKHIKMVKNAWRGIDFWFSWWNFYTWWEGPLSAVQHKEMLQKSTFFGRFVFSMLLSYCLSAFLASTLSQNISFLPLQADGDGFFFLCGAGLCQPLPPCNNKVLTVWSLYCKCRPHGRCSCMLYGIHTQQKGR